jgi:ABC-type multidrug transport system fused ATPase/permease subunit
MTAKARKVERLAALWPDVRALIWPRRWTMALGLALVGVSRLAGIAAPAAMKYLIDDVLGQRKVELLPGLVLLVASATLVQAGTGYVLNRVFSASTVRLVAELRCKLHEHVLRLPLLYHDQSRTGDLGTRIMNDVVSLQNLVGTGMIDFAGSVATAVIAFAVMTRFSPSLAAVGFVGLVGFGALIARSTRRQKAIGHERSDVFGDLMARLTEALGGIRVLKAYRAEERERAIFAGRVGRLVDIYLKSSRLNAATSLVTTVVWGLVNAVVMYLGARQILAGKLTLGSFFTFTVLLNYMVAPLFQILGIGTLLIEALVGLERSRAVLGERPEDGDPRRQAAIGAIRGEVVLDAIEFAYAPGKAVLHDVSLRAEPGTVTALVGPSGAGKSTIIGLIASFYVPTAGTIRVDGTDLGTVRLDAYRSQLGVVLQETFLFAGSILDNIAFARPGATRAEILAAARVARVDEFAEKLEEGYDTLIGERGVRLSGGQRQRISIARSLLADPRILILDEATSSLDSSSEALIQEALAHLLVGRTTFVIAHRLSTIRRADQILVVDGGRIVERGTHASLCALGGLYAGMYRKQHEVEANLFLAPGEGEKLLVAGPAAAEDAPPSLPAPAGMPL